LLSTVELGELLGCARTIFHGAVATFSACKRFYDLWSRWRSQPNHRRMLEEATPDSLDYKVQAEIGEHQVVLNQVASLPKDQAVQQLYDLLHNKLKNTEKPVSNFAKKAAKTQQPGENKSANSISTVAVPKKAKKQKQVDVTSMPFMQNRGAPQVNRFAMRPQQPYANDHGILTQHYPPQKIGEPDLLRSLWLRSQLNPMDAMTACKLWPGERSAPYTTSGGVARCGNGLIQATASETTTSNAWALWAYSPIVGSLNKGAGYYYTYSAGAESTTGSTIATNVKTSGYSSLYGGDPSFSSSTLIWASELAVTIEAAAATVSGTVWTGLFPFKMLENSTTTVYNMRTFMHKEALTVGSKFGGRVSVQDHHVIKFMQDATGTVATNMNYGDELVLVILIHNPALSISGGSASWSPVIDVRSNYAFYPKITDAWSQSLYYNSTVTVDYPDRVLPSLQSAISQSHIPANVFNAAKVKEILSTLVSAQSMPNMKAISSEPVLTGYAWNSSEVMSYVSQITPLHREWATSDTEVTALQEAFNANIEIFVSRLRALCDGLNKPKTSLRSSSQNDRRDKVETMEAREQSFLKYS